MAPASQEERNNEENAGSSESGESVFLAVGRLRRPHGIHGEIILEIMTDFPERIRRNKRVYVGDDRRELRITNVRPHPHGLLISFRGIDTPEQAGELRNQLVLVKAEHLPKLPEGEYYHHEMLGLEVVNEAEERLGVLEEILETGANDVYLIRTPEGEELLLPAIQDVLIGVDLEARQIRVRPPEYS